MLNKDTSTHPTDAKEQFSLGLRYATGMGVPRDYDQAIQWFTKSAEQGNPYAQFNLGIIFENGEGVIKDLAQAIEWYTKSAEQGNSYAQVRIGWLYSKGLGVPLDYYQAVKWYTKAAEQGNQDAQYRPGLTAIEGKDALKANTIIPFGRPLEIAKKAFGGPQKYNTAITQLENRLYQNETSKKQA